MRPDGGLRARSRVDIEEWPLVILRWPSRVVTPDEFTDTYEDLQVLLDQEDPVVVAVFASQPGTDPIFNASQRRYVAEFFERNAAKYQQMCCGVAVVAYSALMRGVVTAINWFRPPPFEFSMFSNQADARRWCEERYEARTGVSLTEAIAKAR